MSILAGVAVTNLVNAPSRVWTFSEFVDQADAGRLTAVDITGTQVVAIDRQGTRHSVRVDSRSAELWNTIMDDGINSTIRSADPWRMTLFLALPIAMVALIAVGVAALLTRFSP